ncbi:MAG: efflux RND transporter periplasmic adaptor subunit [Planctomycetota bacterium]
MKKIIIGVLIIGGILLAVAYKLRIKTTESEPLNEHSEEQFVKIDANDLERLGIKLDQVGPGKIKVELTLPAEVALDPDRMAYITPRFTGVVKEIKKSIGDRVNKNDILALIESNESLTSYEVKSSLSGTIIKRDLTLGEVVNEEKNIFIVTDISTVWVNLTIHQKDLVHIRNGQPVVVSAGPSIPEAAGLISYVSPVLDEDTHTASARVILPNPQSHWRPGMFVTARVVVEEAEVALLVPTTTLQSIDNQTCVFIKTDEGFKAQVVTVGRTDQDSSEVTAGLKAGQVVVTGGSFSIKSALLKERIGHHEEEDER